jgi:stress-induced morphogen
MATKKHSTKKHSAKKSMTKKHTDGTTMHTHCVGCGKKVDILDVHEETFKGKGSVTRKRLVGKCSNGHKFFRFMKSN